MNVCRYIVSSIYIYIYYISVFLNSLLYFVQCSILSVNIVRVLFCDVNMYIDIFSFIYIPSFLDTFSIILMKIVPRLGFCDLVWKYHLVPQKGNSIGN